MTLSRSQRSLPALALLAVGAGLLAPSPGLAQDTIQVRDTVPGADSVALPDTVPADTIVHRLPAFPGDRPAGDPALVARWDREELLRARGLTLVELLAPLPGMIPLRSGDYGAPEGIVANGRAGGRLRVFIDGVEETPLDGSAVDLAQVSLGGMASVEVSRSGGETRIHLTTLQPSGPAPVSAIEAGTGDLDTNIFRGTFLHPNAFGGGLSLLFERVDSDGPGGDEEGSLQGVWLRYVRPLGDRLALSAEFRNRPAKSALERTPPEAGRSTRSLRLRARLAEGVALEAFATQHRLDLTSGMSVVDSMVIDTIAGDTTVVILDRPEVTRATQFGGRLGWGFENFWGEAAFRYIDHPAGRATLMRTDVDGGVAHPGVGGVSGRFGWDRESQVNRIVWGASAWTRPILGVSLFGSLDQGVRGWWEPVDTLGGWSRPDSVEALYPTASDGTFLRAGARFQGGPLTLEGAWLRTEVDSVLPLGSRVDLGLQAFPGDEATGFQVSGSVALPLPGFTLEGSLEQWEEEGILRPERIYRGGLTFHDTFYPTGNLEITGSALVEGRSPMLLPLADPGTGGPVRVPFYQSWNVHLQIRVVTVRLFIRWDNLFLRPNNQDLPDRVLPRTRAMYGVRWTLTN